MPRAERSEREACLSKKKVTCSFWRGAIERFRGGGLRERSQDMRVRLGRVRSSGGGSFWEGSFNVWAGGFVWLPIGRKVRRCVGIWAHGFAFCTLIYSETECVCCIFYLVLSQILL